MPPSSYCQRWPAHERRYRAAQHRVDRTRLTSGGCPPLQAVSKPLVAEVAMYAYVCCCGPAAWQQRPCACVHPPRSRCQCGDASTATDRPSDRPNLWMASRIRGKPQGSASSEASPQPPHPCPPPRVAGDTTPHARAGRHAAQLTPSRPRVCLAMGRAWGAAVLLVARWCGCCCCVPVCARCIRASTRSEQFCGGGGTGGSLSQFHARRSPLERCLCEAWPGALACVV